ncbi:Serine protease inhibitor 3/4 [Papilio xuthus]|uniref:Serine protease inhibitor 3/4 n=1 Tax=Papilio xuthus TaxID=66420 RepID=A0A194PY84_PAPXU|nr:Serine protease inhibitor 3/4 [Papilio xuthus]
MGRCSNDAALLLEGNLRLTTKFFSEVAKNNNNDSFVMSPFSVLTPLAQLVLGSGGGTHNEILTAIGMPNDQSTISAFTELTTRLGSLEGTVLRLVNRIYVSKKFNLNKHYAAMTDQTLNSEIKSADFSQADKTATEINKWVEVQTNNRIKNLIDPKDLSKVVVLLVNSIYFQSTWQNQFSIDSTTSRDFHVTKNITVKVPMMRQTATFNFVRSDELKSTIIELPYVGNNSALYIILPNDVEGITQLQNALNDYSILEKALQNMQTDLIDVQIPRFTIETKINLKSVLRNLGVEKVFDPIESDLSKIVDEQSEQLYVGQATQKAFVEVNEKGTAAGAANGKSYRS